MRLYVSKCECFFVCVAVGTRLNVCMYAPVVYVYLSVFVLFVLVCGGRSPHREAAHLERELMMESRLRLCGGKDGNEFVVSDRTCHCGVLLRKVRNIKSCAYGAGGDRMCVRGATANTRDTARISQYATNSA